MCVGGRASACIPCLQHCKYEQGLPAANTKAAGEARNGTILRLAVPAASGASESHVVSNDAVARLQLKHIAASCRRLPDYSILLPAEEATARRTGELGERLRMEWHPSCRRAACATYDATHNGADTRYVIRVSETSANHDASATM